MRVRAVLSAIGTIGCLTVAVQAGGAAVVAGPPVVPPQIIEHALACTAVPFWLQQATPIETLRDDAPGAAAFFYPYNHTIYLKASSYLRDAHGWNIPRIAMVLGHEYGHAFQRIAAPAGSPAWKQFERLTPGFENVPVGVRSYQAWRNNRAEAFAEAYRLIFGGTGAAFDALVPLSVTPAMRAYFQALDASMPGAGRGAGGHTTICRADVT